MDQNQLNNEITLFLNDLLDLVKAFNNQTGYFIQGINLETELAPNAIGAGQVYSIFPPSINLHPISAKPARHPGQRKKNLPAPTGAE